MKYYLFIISFFYTSLYFGQIKKGDLFIGGTLEYSTRRDQSFTNDQLYQEVKFQYLKILPKFSYQFADKYRFSGGVGYTFTKSETFPNFIGSGNEQTMENSPIFPFEMTVSHNRQLSAKVYFDININSSYTYIKTRTKNNGGVTGTNYLINDSYTHLFSNNIGLGISLILSKRFTASANFELISYEYLNMKIITSNGWDYEENIKNQRFNILVDKMTPEFSVYYRIIPENN